MKQVLLLILILFVIQGCSKKESGIVESFDGVKISYSVEGKNEPSIVFISGWAGTKEDFVYQVEYFNKKYRTVSIDLAGFGASGNNRDEWSMDNFAEDVNTVINHLKLNEVVLVGQSMGGIVSLEVAKKIPNKVIGIVPVDVIGNLEASLTPKQIDGAVGWWMDWAMNPTYKKVSTLFSENIDSTYINNVLNDLKESEKIGWEESNRNVLEYMFKPNNLSQNISIITTPIHCINGVNNKTNIDLLDESNSNRSVSYIDNTGHFFLWDDSEKFNSLLEEAINTFISKS